MPRRPATITQADVARAIRAAKQTGAAEVEVKVGNAIITVRLSPSSTADDAAPLVPKHEVVL